MSLQDEYNRLANDKGSALSMNETARLLWRQDAFFRCLLFMAALGFGAAVLVTIL